LIDFATWLTVASICLMGAMSPGLSLAVVLRHTLTGGRRNGCIVAITHGIGVGLYAFACISGLALLITASPGVFRAFQWAGAGYLIWLGIHGLLAKAPTEDQITPPPATSSAVRDGLLIVILNPNVAVFFIALFSQVIGPDTGLVARSGYAATAWFIDSAWYLIVAWLFSTPKWLGILQHHSVWFERLFGVILLALATRLLLQSLA